MWCRPVPRLVLQGLGTLVASVFVAFLTFVIGGWCAAKVSGLSRAEPAILHGAIAWMVAVPLIVLLIAAAGEPATDDL